MAQENVTPSSGDEAATRDVCLAVNLQVREALDEELAGLNRSIKMKVGLIVFIVLYMTWAVNRIGIIDAEFLLSTARFGLHDSQQSLVQDASDELKRSAPMTVRGLRRDLISSIPSLRTDAERAALTSVDAVAKEINAALTRDVAELLVKYKTQIESSNPTLSDGDKLQRMVFLMRQDFRHEADKVARSRSAEFSADLKKFNKQLSRLREGKNLTPTEQVQRDLLATWHKLAVSKLKKGEIAPTQ